MMNSEWLKVMLDEIARKKAEAEQDRIEDERRRLEAQTTTHPHDRQGNDVIESG
jgi:hypothetical protein